MTYLKRGLFGLFILFLVLLLAALLVLKVEDVQTAYLQIKNQPALQRNSYVIRNVNLVPMTADTISPNKSVQVVDGRITAIGPDVGSANDPVIDGRGFYLSPGLVDMHMHLWDKFELGLYLAYGVTAVRNLLGMPFHLAVKKEISDQRLLGPLFYTASPQFTGAEDEDIMKKTVGSAQEAKKLVQAYKKQGYDYIKTYNLLPEAIFNSVLTQSKISGLPVVAHPSFKVNYAYHYQPSISTVEHTEDIYQQPLQYSFNRAKLDKVVQGYAASNQTHCPTLTVFYNLAEIYNKGEAVLTTRQAGYINPFISSAAGDYERHMAIRAGDSTAGARINRQHRFHLEIVQKLHKAGVNIVCGTDAGIVNTAAGLSVHQELAFYVQAGLSNYEALKTATVNPARVYTEYKNFGTIEPGKWANFILSEKNPLTQLHTLQDPEWVMVKGRLIDRKLIKEFKAKAYKRNNYLASMIRTLKYAYWDK